MKKRPVAFKLFYLILIGLAVISCVPQAKMKYLQDKEGDSIASEFKNIKPDYKLKPGDYLYIRVLTLDQKSNELFASMNGSGGTNGYTNTTDQSLYLTSYLVNDSGFISFPLLGNIPTAGHTVIEMKQSLNKLVSEIIRESSVVVKLVLFDISVLGEVKNPGKFTVNKDHINIFEALALANDITAFGNRTKVQIIRADLNKNEIVTIDLLSKDILSSPYYYLQPNDIIYVEPMKEKAYAFETFPYGLVYSTIGLVLVILTFFK
ncbi:MAG: polysaccharide biosynthesis/export family protein [Bacteroidales bacterium]|nr:polysaccharide biosynthesis/export family protein [Bacteroidales bacterium]